MFSSTRFRPKTLSCPSSEHIFYWPTCHRGDIDNDAPVLPVLSAHVFQRQVRPSNHRCLHRKKWSEFLCRQGQEAPAIHVHVHPHTYNLYLFTCIWHIVYINQVICYYYYGPSSLSYQVDINGLAPVLLIVDAGIVDNDVQMTKGVHCPLEGIWSKQNTAIKGKTFTDITNLKELTMETAVIKVSCTLIFIWSLLST